MTLQETCVNLSIFDDIESFVIVSHDPTHSLKEVQNGLTFSKIFLKIFWVQYDQLTQIR